jgi:hypothetical protein
MKWEITIVPVGELPAQSLQTLGEGIARALECSWRLGCPAALTRGSFRPKRGQFLASPLLGGP